MSSYQSSHLSYESIMNMRSCILGSQQLSLEVGLMRWWLRWTRCCVAAPSCTCTICACRCVCVTVCVFVCVCACVCVFGRMHACVHMYICKQNRAHKILLALAMRMKGVHCTPCLSHYYKSKELGRCLCSCCSYTHQLFASSCISIHALTLSSYW